MEIKTAIDAFAALAQETRLDIFRLLVKAGPEGRAAGAIAETLGLPGATLSFHLNHLRQAGMIDQTREGRSLRYSVRFDTVQSLLTFLMEDCCQGQIPVGALAQSCCVPVCEVAQDG